MAQVDAPNTKSAPPGPVHEASATNAQPETPAPPQPQTKSAPGGQSPNGANGVNLKGKAVTKGPNTRQKAKKSPDAAPAPAQDQVAAAPASTPATHAPAATAPATTPKPTVLAGYLDDLGSALKLSPTEKKDIEGYYEADGVPMQNLLNDRSIPPIKQAQQVSDLRDQINAKIVALLADVDRQRNFLQIEANYRVALIESAMAGGLNPPGAAPAVPSPTATAPGDANAAPDPDVQKK
jgi:hypothetical protein